MLILLSPRRMDTSTAYGTVPARWTLRTLSRQLADRQRRLLVVDDYQPGAEAIAASLSLSGYDAQFVLSGRAAVSFFSAWAPEIILLDINLPGMDGFEVARQLRQDGRSQHVAIVAFTAQDESGIRAEGVASGNGFSDAAVR